MTDEPTTTTDMARAAFLGRIQDRIKIVAADGTEKEYVGAGTYLTMVADRDELRRTLAYVSAARVPGMNIDVDALLARHGETMSQARTTASIIASVRDDRG